MASWNASATSRRTPDRPTLTWDRQNQEEGASMDNGSTSLLTRDQLASSVLTNTSSPATPFSSYGYAASSAIKGVAANASMLSLTGRSQELSFTHNAEYSPYSSAQHYSRLHGYPEVPSGQDSSPGFHGLGSQNLSLGAQPSRTLGAGYLPMASSKKSADLKDDLQHADVGLRLQESGAGNMHILSLLSVFFYILHRLSWLLRNGTPTTDGSISIKSIDTQGSADREGSIKPGDVLLTVNGLSKFP
jgi:hypothetical protein